MDAVATIIAGISIHSLRMEGDQIKVFDDARKQDISIHSLRMEGDQETDFSDVLGGYFNPLPPHGGRPRSSFCAIIIIRFQSTPSAWRETQVLAAVCLSQDISIHSLRMEGDQIVLYYFVHPYISIHSLRMEGDSTA